MHVDHSRDNNLTDFGKATLTDRYLMPDENYQDLFARVAKAYSNDEQHAQRLYNYMSNLWFMPATPVLSNAGNERGLPISCFLSEVGDGMEEIIENWVENTWLSVMGGGLGVNYENIRSIGERIGKGGTSSGVVPFIKVQDSLTLAVNQGGLRRSSAAAYMPVHHPEIKEFIEIRRPTGGDPNRRSLNMHNAVVIDDKFMEAVVEGKSYDLLSPKDGSVISTVDARDIWQRILTARLETGEPYIMFVDTVNDLRPEHVKKLGLKIKMSNLCVAPETVILTDQGYKTISKLENQKVQVWNGEQYSETTIIKTGNNRELIRVTFSDGSSIDCTPEHKFYVKRTYTSKVKEIKAIKLQAGDKLEKFDLPYNLKINKPLTDCLHPYAQGFYAGDGNENYEFSWIYLPKQEVIQHLRVGKVSEEFDSYGRKRWDHGKETFKEKFFVPLNYSEEIKLKWLAGLLDADGCVIQSDNGENIQLVSTQSNFLREIKLMLQELGIPCSVSFKRKAGEYLLPLNDGSNDTAFYQCKELWLINLNCEAVKRLQKLGLKCHRLKLSKVQEPQRNASRFVTVVSVEKTGRISDTYCFNEPLKHRGMFNGILTGQCSEIVLPTGLDQFGKNRTAVCCLSSLNLETYDQWKDNPDFILDIMYFLDNALESFIRSCGNTHMKARYSAIRERSVGLGVMGLHSLYQQKNSPFGSKEARELNLEIFDLIKRKTCEANYFIAQERGACPDAKDAGFPYVRFSHCTAIAPTASISIICGGTSPGIEPSNANFFTHKTLSGSFKVQNKYLKKVLEAYNKDDQDTWTSIANHEGSVQHLDFLSRHEKEVFKTFIELDQMDIIFQASDRTPYIDQSQSVNISVSATVSKRRLHELHLAAWELGLKTLYYCRSKSVGRVEKLSVKVERQVIDIFEKPDGDTKYEVCEACQ